MLGKVTRELQPCQVLTKAVPALVSNKGGANVVKWPVQSDQVLLKLVTLLVLREGKVTNELAPKHHCR